MEARVESFGPATRAEPSVPPSGVVVDRQWRGVPMDEVSRRIAAAAREAVALHLEEAVRSGAVMGGSSGSANGGDSVVAFGRTQAASLALLADRVRRERAEKARSGEVAS